VVCSCEALVLICFRNVTSQGLNEVTPCLESPQHRLNQADQVIHIFILLDARKAVDTPSTREIRKNLEGDKGGKQIGIARE
jgi:hypothetical protein